MYSWHFKELLDPDFGLYVWAMMVLGAFASWGDLRHTSGSQATAAAQAGRDVLFLQGCQTATVHNMCS